MFNVKEADQIINIWSQINMKIILKRFIRARLDYIFLKYKNESRHRCRSFSVFMKYSKELFNIAKPRLKEFMLEQNNERNLTIPE